MTDLGTNCHDQAIVDGLIPTRGPTQFVATPKWKVSLAWGAYWIVLGVSFGLTAWLSRLTSYAWYIMVQVNVVLVVIFEEIIPKKEENSLFRDRQSWNDIAHMMLYKLVFRPLAWTVALAYVSFVSRHWQNSKDIWPSHLPWPLQFLILWLIFDLIGYLYHRALHHFDFMFAFHALHHDTPSLHVLKANRLHIGEEVVNFLIVVPPMILAGCPPAMMIWLGMFEAFENNLAHSNMDQRFPRWFHYIMRTADVHYIHHSDASNLQLSNFGGLPIWDIIFGTYRHPDEHRLTTTGVGDYPAPNGFFGQLLFPLLKPFRGKSRP